MDKQIKAQLVIDALLMATWKGKPAKGLIWHTDRRSQYAFDSHREILKQHNVIQSMSRKGNCWDNKQEIFEYIEEFDNRIRLHSANDYLSPIDYENRQESA